VRINAPMVKASNPVVAAEERAKQAGLKVDDLCKAADVHRATWQRWKAGVTSPPLKKWQAVEALLGQRDAA